MAKNKKIPIHSVTESVSGMNIMQIGPEVSLVTPHDISLPHRHGHYFCILLESGEMEFLIDFNKVTLKANTLFLSYPGQVLQFLSKKECLGWVLFFEHALIGEKARTLLDQFLSETIPMDLSTSQVALIRNMLGTMDTVYHEGRTDIFRKQTIQALLMAYVYQISSVYALKENKELIEYSPRHIEIAKTFWQLLRRETVMKKPSKFASEMNITTGYLNDVVKRVTGFSVTDLIHREVIKEAQRLMFYSNLPLKVVADRLGFNDYSYFLRVFNKTSGQSPGSFRGSSLQ
jgi:AraC family transcriptional activator of pobA